MNFEERMNHHIHEELKQQNEMIENLLVEAMMLQDFDKLDYLTVVVPSYFAAGINHIGVASTI